MRRLALVPLLGLAAACASIPREAPELSAELGKRLNDIEAAHFALLHAYFDERRDRVDGFVSREWVPVFADEVFERPMIAAAWDSVVASGSRVDRLQFIRILGPAIQARINAKREELQAPLDEVERAMERRLRDDYAQTKAMNNSITSFLVSASDVAETRERYLEMFGVTESDMAAAVDRLDDAVARLMEAREAGETLASRGETFAARLREIAARLSGGGPTP